MNKNSLVNSEVPKYQVLSELLREQIQSGQLLPGAALPTYNSLRAEHGMTISTIERAYGILEQEGLIERRHGRGIFVTQPKRTFTGNIGLVGSEGFFGKSAFAFNQSIMEGIEKYTEENNLRVMLLGNCKNLDKELSRQVDGVLLYNIEYHQERLKNLPASLPRISMFIKGSEISNVVVDDYEAAKIAVRHLVSRGHRKIACLMEKCLSIPTLRFNGYRDALAEEGIDYQANWARITDFVCLGPNQSTYLTWGRDTMKQWIEEDWAESGCSALLVQNDNAAIGAMQVLQEFGIRVPKDVSIMGFDGTELCHHVTPRLSSVKIPLAEIGYTATKMLCEQIYQGESENRTIMLSPSLLPGDSVATVD